MDRWTPGIAILCLLACGETEPACTAEDCAETCAEQKTPVQPLTREDPKQLSELERGMLSQRLILLERGPVPVDADGLTLCPGRTACEGPPVDLSAGPLPPGEYVARAELFLPEDGTWDLKFRLVCNPELPPDDEGEPPLLERTINVTARRKQNDPIFVREGFLRVLSPLHEQLTNCTLFLDASGPAGGSVHHTNFTIPGRGSPS